MARTRVYAAGSNPHTQSPDRHIYKSHALRLAPPPGILHGSCTAVARGAHEVSTTEMCSDGPISGFAYCESRR